VAIAGRLSEYSLAEVFRLIEDGHKTGLLSINHNGLQGMYQSHVWFQQGRIVAHTNSLKGRELVELFIFHCRFNENLAAELRANSRSVSSYMGYQLEARGLINAEQLDTVFLIQVLRPVRRLFHIKDAAFFFDEMVSPAKSEMTGLSVSCAEMSLRGLRSLINPEHLRPKLPEPEYALQVQALFPVYPLDAQEIAIWQMANGQYSIAEIARKTNLSIVQAQYVAFRLIVVGLLGEVAPECPAVDPDRASPVIESISGVFKSTISKRFLNNLVGFLKKKG
jgi:hypothetical protein